MLNFIDNFLNKITMYRLILYYLMTLIFTTILFSTFGLLSYNPLSIIFSTLLITFICWLTNIIFGRVFEAPINIESVYITALIIVLIINPIKGIGDSNYFVMAIWASILAISSKYIIAIRKKHIFNPAAFAVALISFTLYQSASWWVGTTIMAPFVLIGGLLITRKIRRLDLVGSFALVVLAGIIGLHFNNPAGVLSGLLNILQKTFLIGPFMFLAFVMLTEPLTSPPTSNLRICYGAIVGFFFIPDLHIGSIYSTPELALLIGNLFVYLVSPKTKLILKLKEIVPIATDAYDFVFTTNQKFNFKPGQYLEWTFAHPHPDNRGNRRYFTIASSPTEPDIKMGLKFYSPASTYKKNLLAMIVNDTLVGSQLAGDFTLPKNKDKKLVFIAGGIGVTPFRSMIKYLVDTKESRAITMFYSNKTKGDFAYTKDFDAAELQLGIKTVYTITDKESAPANWIGETGFVNKEMIQKYVPDYTDRTYYISGPHMMVTTFEKMLHDMGVSSSQIKTDFFPGFA